MVVPVEPSPHARTAGTLQILVTTDLFHGALDLAAAVELLQASRDRTYAAGDVICSQGDKVDSLCVIRSGTVLLERHGVSRALSYCDYFGEVTVAQRGATPQARSDATARAASSVEIVEIPRSAVHFLLERHPLLSRRVLRRSALMSSAASASWRAIGANSVFAQFSLSQVAQLQSVMNPTQASSPNPQPLTPNPNQVAQLQSVMTQERVAAGARVFSRGDAVTGVVLVSGGAFCFEELPCRGGTQRTRAASQPDELPADACEPFAQGALLVDLFALFTGQDDDDDDDEPSIPCPAPGSPPTAAVSRERAQTLDAAMRDVSRPRSLSAASHSPSCSDMRGDLHARGVSGRSSTSSRSDLHQLSLVAISDGEIFRISKKDFVEFIENNPGAFIWMRDTLVVE